MDTFHATLEVLDACSQEWFILENVDATAEGENTALGQIVLVLSNKGYDVQTFVIDANDYGLAQSRKRVYVVGVRRPSRTLAIVSYDKFLKLIA